MVIFAPPRSGSRGHWPPCASTLVSCHVPFPAMESVYDCIHILNSSTDFLRRAAWHRAVGRIRQRGRGCHIESNGGQIQARAEASKSGSPGYVEGAAKFQFAATIAVESDGTMSISYARSFLCALRRHQPYRASIASTQTDQKKLKRCLAAG